GPTARRRRTAPTVLRRSPEATPRARHAVGRRCTPIVYPSVAQLLIADHRDRSAVPGGRRQPCNPATGERSHARYQVHVTISTWHRGDHMLVAQAARCLVTGGAGFIGSHVAERLVALGHAARVVDDLSTGDVPNLAGLDVALQFLRGDL